MSKGRASTCGSCFAGVLADNSGRTGIALLVYTEIEEERLTFAVESAQYTEYAQ